MGYKDAYSGVSFGRGVSPIDEDDDDDDDDSGGDESGDVDDNNAAEEEKGDEVDARACVYVGVCLKKGKVEAEDKEEELRGSGLGSHRVTSGLWMLLVVFVYACSWRASPCCRR